MWLTGRLSAQILRRLCVEMQELCPGARLTRTLLRTHSWEASPSLTARAPLAPSLLAKTPSVAGSQSYRPCIHPGQDLQAQRGQVSVPRGLWCALPVHPADSLPLYVLDSWALPAGCWVATGDSWRGQDRMEGLLA